MSPPELVSNLFAHLNTSKIPVVHIRLRKTCLDRSKSTYVSIIFNVNSVNTHEAKVLVTSSRVFTLIQSVPPEQRLHMILNEDQTLDE